MDDPPESPPSHSTSPLPSSPSSPHTRSSRRLDLSFTAADHSQDSTRTASPEPLATPTLAQSYGQLRKSLSLSNIAQLDREGVRSLSTHIYRRGSRIDRRQYRPKDDDEVLAHALRGGIRCVPLPPPPFSSSFSDSLSTQARSSSARPCAPPSTLPSSSCASPASGASLRLPLSLSRARLTLVSARARRGLSSKLILHALFGTDVVRFGGMLGLFTFL